MNRRGEQGVPGIAAQLSLHVVHEHDSRALEQLARNPLVHLGGVGRPREGRQVAPRRDDRSGLEHHGLAGRGTVAVAREHRARSPECRACDGREVVADPRSPIVVGDPGHLLHEVEDATHRGVTVGLGRVVGDPLELDGRLVEQPRGRVVAGHVEHGAVGPQHGHLRDCDEGAHAVPALARDGRLHDVLAGDHVEPVLRALVVPRVAREGRASP